MDDRNVVDRPFEDDLEPAITPIDAEVYQDGQTEPQFGTELIPAIRRLEDDASGGEPSLEALPDPEALAGPIQRLEPTIQPVWILQAGISAFILGAIGSIAFTFLPIGDTWFGGVIFLLAFVFGSIHAVLRYRIWRYRVREDSLYLERGVFRRVRTVVPHVRIQHVDVSRSPTERVFGLATTVVYTAGSRGADVAIPGLTPERADDLQTRLKQLAIAAEGDDAV